MPPAPPTFVPHINIILHPPPNPLRRKSPLCCTNCPTPLTPITFRDRTIYVKRDDTLNFAGVTGSKVRKFQSLLSDDALHAVDYVFSYGGTQSNAMLALANLCNFHNKPFVYVTRPLHASLATAPGNYSDALRAGMIHVSINDVMFQTITNDVIPRGIEPVLRKIIAERNFRFARPNSTPLFIPQGGAWHGAEAGVQLLARELRDQIAELRSEKLLALKKPLLFLPSGTGTTAFFLQKHLADVVNIVAVPVAGNERYLVKQMRWLDDWCSDGENRMKTPVLPDVLRPRLRGAFADIRKEKLLIWREMRRSTHGEFDFDLVYAPKAWEEVMLAIVEGRLASEGEDLFYYHSGGVEGNVSMLDRFKRKGML